MSQHLIIALDGMGGDAAPRVVMEGAELALKKHPHVRFRIFGDEAQLWPLLSQMPALQQASTIIHTDAAIAAHEKPSVALRQGGNSSMRLAINDVREGNAVAVVSAGNTGALMAMAKFVFKTLPGVDRPAICSAMPTGKGDCIFLDMGANIDCNAHILFQFAVMGAAFARAVLHIEKPTIGLLNVGSEDIKGHESVREAAEMLRASALSEQFIGFVEGNHLLHGNADVVVTDGFTGNIAIKTAEGLSKLFSNEMKKAYNTNLLTMVAGLLSKPVLRKVKRKMDPNLRNGGMFVGLNGIAIKSHGGTDAYGFANAIRVAVNIVENRLNETIQREIAAFDAHLQRQQQDKAPVMASAGV